MASMLSHSSVQPQVLAALSQLSSIFNGLRTVAHTPVGGQKQRKGTRSLVTSSQRSTVTESVAASQSGAQHCYPFSNIEVSDLLQDLKVPDEHAILSLLQRSSVGVETSHWKESHVAAESFFENKTGFPESQLSTDFSSFSSLHLLGDSRIQRLLQENVFSPAFQQTRGFKTRRADIVSGMGKEAPGGSVLDDLRKSVYSKIFTQKKSGKPTAKFSKIVTAHESNPEFQDKLKVAFAEGYHAQTKQGPEGKSTFLNRTFRVFFYLCLIWLVIQVLQLFTAVGGGVRGLGVLNREQFEVNPEEIHVTFDDVKGVEEAKQELKDVVEFLRDPERFTSLGAKLPKGILLVGPPGIGKTLLARAVAGEAGVPFFHASGSEFDEIFVGTGAKRVRQMFSAAKARSPCVIFIDEIDSVGAKRTSSQIHPYANQTINQLLSEMDGFTQNEGVMVLGATNRRDNLDKALLRPGRFDVEVKVFPPDMKGRQEILELYLAKIKKDSDIDVEKLARGTTGFTGADLENMVNQAALKAAMDGDIVVSMVHMEFARDKVIMGPAKKSKIIDDETNWLTAYHEAGHTLVAYHTKDAVPLHKVTIIPRGMSLGHTSFIEEKEVYNKTKSQLNAELDVAMGGRAAEELVYGTEKVTTGASSDFQMATSIATSMVRRFGMSEKVGMRVFDDQDPFDSGLSMVKVNEVSPAVQELVDSEIKRILQESYERAKQILRIHSSEHKALAQALIKYETLDKEEIKLIIEGKKLKKQIS